MSNTKNTTTTIKPQVASYLHAIEASQEIMKNIQARQKKQDILVMGGYGASLQVRSITGIKCLVYKHKQDEPQVFMPRVHGLRKIVWMFCVTRPSMIAVQWMQRERIQFICIDKSGEDLTEKEWRNDDTILQKIQFMLTDEQERDYARSVIKQKVLQQAKTLRKYAHMFRNNTEMHVEAIEGMSKWFDFKNGRGMISKKAIMSSEQQCATRYFEAWHGMQVRWIKSDEKNVHPVYKSFQNRSNGYESSNKHARHPVNACLNYLNAIIAHRIKLTCMERGLHLKMSFLHLRQDNRTQAGVVKPDQRDNLVYDLIETVRPSIEAALLKFLEKNELHLEWFIIDEFGEVHCAFMLSQLLTLWIETEIKDKAIEEPVDAYCSWLREQGKAMKFAAKETDEDDELMEIAN